MTKVGLVQCNIVNNDYQNNTRVKFTLINKLALNKSFDKSINISSQSLTFLKTYNAGFSRI